MPLTRTLCRGKALADELGRWDRFPCVLKPATRSPRFAEVGQGQKALRLESRSELEGLLRVIETYESDFVVQAAIEGGEDRIVSYHAYVRPGGQVMAEFTGRKLRTAPRLYGFSTYIEITNDDEVRRLGRSLLEKLGFSGVVKIDFKRDTRDNKLYLLEINPRFNLWHHPAAVAGVSIPALVYRDCIEPGSARPAGELSFTRWLAEIATVDVNESFLLRDPVPGLASLCGMLRRRMGRVRLLSRRPPQPIAGTP